MPDVNGTGGDDMGKLQDEISRLRRKIAELSEQAIRDPLTGLYNRRLLDEMLPRMLSQAQRLNYPVTVAMADIDHFKELNDCYGHQAGDTVLKRIASLLEASTRLGDFAFRFGGEEFLLVFPGMPIEGAAQRLEQVRQDIANQHVVLGQHTLARTISIGIASYSLHANTSDELIAAADQALYRAKNGGRNRVCIYGAC